MNSFGVKEGRDDVLNIYIRQLALFGAFCLGNWSASKGKRERDNMGGNLNQCIAGAGCSGLIRGRKDDGCLKSYFKPDEEKLIYLCGFR